MRENLEHEVARIYELLGAEHVEHDCILGERQIDVLVHMLLPDRTKIRIAVECKDYSSNVGVKEVTRFAEVVALLQRRGEIDKGVLVARKGFTNRAKKQADRCGISRATLETLRRSIANFHPYVAQLAQLCENDYTFVHNCYVPLTATTESGESIQPIEDYFDEWMIGDGKQLTVLGDYGTGKTTLALRLTYRQVQRYVRNPSRERVPILLFLRDFAKEFKMRSLLRDTLVDQYNVRLPDYWSINRLNSRGAFLLILDGFDEMASRVDEGTMLKNFAEIESLVLPNTKVILTCRTHYFKTSEQMHNVHRGTRLYEDLRKRAGIEFLYLERFSAADVEQYLRRRLSRGCWTTVYDKIKRTHNLSELAAHPILLRMMTETLPSVSKSNINAAVLYGEYVHEWLNRDDWRTQMGHDLRAEFARELAWYCLSRRAEAVHYTKLLSLLGEYFPEATLKELDYFDSDIRTCNFLRRDAEGNYSFVHESFLEYFIADLLITDVDEAKFDRFEATLTPEIIGFLSDLVSVRGSKVEEILEAVARCKHDVARGNLTALLCKLGAEMRDVSLAGACLRGVELDGVRLVDCDLSGADLSGGSFVGADFERTSLKGANLSYAHFREACLDDADLREAICRGTEFVGASVERTKMQHSDLTKADFRQARMGSANLSNAKGRHAYFDEADARRATFDGADLAEASLRDSMIAGASFVGTHLENARLELTDEGLTGACFAGAKLADVQGLNASMRKHLDHASSLGCRPGRHVCR